MFDYEQPDVPNSAIADVVADIRSQGKPPQLTAEEIEQRRLDHEAHERLCREREAEWHAEYQRRAAVKQQMARRGAMVAAQQAQREGRLQQDREDRERKRESEIAKLRSQVKRQDWWQQEVERAATNAAAVQQRLTLFGELDAMINAQFAPPKPDELKD
jgi:hypothetical protein